jgi:hypothetical protein
MGQSQTYVLKPSLERICGLYLIGETARTIDESVMEAKRVCSIRDGGLYGLFGGDETKGILLVDDISLARWIVED